MDRCDECKHKDSCVCVPYGCECFELDLEEHDKQIRADAIEECIKHIKLYKYNDGTYVVYDEILDEIAEQLKGAEQ